MDYYFDIKIVPDEEVPIHFIRNKVYSKLHKALFTLKAIDIGVSFPLYKVKLGNVIRLHSTKDSLEKLQTSNWLGGLMGYCQVSAIQPIPDRVQYRTISRKQSTMTEAKLKRLIKRGTISPDKLKAYKAKMFQQELDNPYLELASNSSGHKYRRYLNFGPFSQTPTRGQFDFFGLSQAATIPWF